MSLLGRLAQPFKGYRLLRRLLAEQRLQRRALERIADAVEMAGGQPQSLHAQTFRSYARLKEDLQDPELRDLTEVSYVDNTLQARMLGIEEELKAVLGRDPKEDELNRAFGEAGL